MVNNSLLIAFTSGLPGFDLYSFILFSNITESAIDKSPSFMALLNDAINAIGDNALPFSLFYFFPLLTGAAELSRGSFFGRPFAFGFATEPLLDAVAELSCGGAAF